MLMVLHVKNFVLCLCKQHSSLPNPSVKRNPQITRHRDTAQRKINQPSPKIPSHFFSLKLFSSCSSSSSSLFKSSSSVGKPPAALSLFSCCRAFRTRSIRSAAKKYRIKIKKKKKEKCKCH